MKAGEKARRITVSGYAGYWTASCACGWVGQAHRSVGAYNARPKALREAEGHDHKPVGA